MVECLKSVVGQNESDRKPTLILNGDILELALTTTNVAAMTFERFLELIFPKGERPLFDNKIFFLPGNHDHHLWESARETQYLKHIRSLGPVLPIPWHGTNMLVEHDTNQLPSRFLTTLIQRYPGRSGIFVACAYPNFAVRAKGGNRCVIFHHGHFVERIYHLMSILKTHLIPNSQKPKDIFEIEAENFAWIDFFWSALGRSGQVGKDVDMIYTKLQNPDALKKLIQKAILKNMAGAIRDFKTRKEVETVIETPFVGPRAEKLIDLAIERIIEEIVGAIVDKMIGRERRQPTDFGPALEKGLREYVEEPLHRQFADEYKRVHNAKPPRDLTFVFGHTHKPFERRIKFKNYGNTPVGVYNTGGWVVDSEQTEEVHGGAILLFDEDLNAASLRMYNERKALKDYVVEVHALTDNPLKKRIRKLVGDGKAGPWAKFSKTLGKDVRERRKLIRHKIQRS